MQFHIPDHLKKLGIFDKVWNILEAYVVKRTLEGDKGGNSLDGYNDSEATDYIKGFLEQVIDKEKCMESDTPSEVVYKTVLNYYSNRLFNLRGSMRVFDMLKELAPIMKITIESINYSVDCLSIVISEASVSSTPRKFIEDLISFFSSLLYFEDLENEIWKIKLDLEIKTSSSIGSGAVFYTEYNISEVVKEE